MDAEIFVNEAGSAPGGQLITDPNPDWKKILNFFLKFLWIFEKIVKDLDIFTDPDPQIHYSEPRIRIPEAD
jgi:hypothetical protein